MTKRRKKKAFITVTHREPAWMVKGRRAVKNGKRLAWNVLGGVGIITMIVLLARWMGGG
jgi:hypothetical protein